MRLSNPPETLEIEHGGCVAVRLRVLHSDSEEVRRQQPVPTGLTSQVASSPNRSVNPQNPA